MADVSGAKTARKYRHSFVREPHDGAGRFLDFREALFTIVCGQPNYFDWLIAKQIARCVDAIDADVEERAATQIFSSAYVVLFYLEAKQRFKVTKLAEVARFCDSHGMQIRVVKVE